MAAPRYQPAFIAATFAQVKTNDSSLEYANQASAIAAIDAQLVFTSSGQVSNSVGAVRNILVDPSGAINAQVCIIVMLPASPIVGDPPVRVTVLSDTYATLGGVGHCAVYVQGDTGAGDPIMGSLTALPRMYNAGDTMTFVYLGGNIGWHVEHSRIGVFAMGLYNTATASPAVQTVSPPDHYCFDGSKFVIGAVYNPSLTMILPRNVGSSFQFTVPNASNVGSVGTSALGDIVNGLAAPQLFSVVNRTYTVTCISVVAGVASYLVT